MNQLPSYGFATAPKGKFSRQTRLAREVEVCRSAYMIVEYGKSMVGLPTPI